MACEHDEMEGGGTSVVMGNRGHAPNGYMEAGFFKEGLFQRFKEITMESAGPARKGSRIGERKELFLESGMRCVEEGVSVSILEGLWPS